jgi:hypothetical protein
MLQLLRRFFLESCSSRREAYLVLDNEIFGVCRVLTTHENCCCRQTESLVVMTHETVQSRKRISSELRVCHLTPSVEEGNQDENSTQDKNRHDLSSPILLLKNVSSILDLQPKVMRLSSFIATSSSATSTTSSREEFFILHGFP